MGVEYPAEVGSTIQPADYSLTVCALVPALQYLGSTPVMLSGTAIKNKTALQQQMKEAVQLIKVTVRWTSTYTCISAIPITITAFQK